LPKVDAQAARTRATRPTLNIAVDEVLLEPAVAVPHGGRLLYQPQLHTTAQLHFVNARAKLDDWKALPLLAPIPEARGETLWEVARLFEDEAPATSTDALSAAEYADPPAEVSNEKSFASWEKSLKTWLYQNYRLTLWSCPEVKAISAPGESKSDFRVRITQLLHEKRDLEMEKLRKKYETRYTRLETKIRKAEERIAREEAQYREQTLNTAVSIGSTLLGALLGRRSTRGTIGGAATSARRASRAAREKQDIQRAREALAAANTELAELEARFREDAERVRGVDASAVRIEELPVRPRKSDITVDAFALAWVPRHIGEDGRVVSLL